MNKQLFTQALKKRTEAARKSYNASQSNYAVKPFNYDAHGNLMKVSFTIKDNKHPNRLLGDKHLGFLIAMITDDKRISKEGIEFQIKRVVENLLEM